MSRYWMHAKVNKIVKVLMQHKIPMQDFTNDYGYQDVRFHPEWMRRQTRIKVSALRGIYRSIEGLDDLQFEELLSVVRGLKDAAEVNELRMQENRTARPKRGKK